MKEGENKKKEGGVSFFYLQSCPFPALLIFPILIHSISASIHTHTHAQLHTPTVTHHILYVHHVRHATFFQPREYIDTHKLFDGSDCDRSRYRFLLLILWDLGRNTMSKITLTLFIALAIVVASVHGANTRKNTLAKAATKLRVQRALAKEQSKACPSGSNGECSGNGACVMECGVNGEKNGKMHVR